MKKRHEKQPSISTSTEQLSKRFIAGLTAGALAVAAVCVVSDGHENTRAWPVSDCSAKVTSAEKDPGGSLRVGVELGTDCEGAQGHRRVTVEDPGLAKVEPGDDAQVAVVPGVSELSGVPELSGVFIPRVFVHFPQYGKDTYGLVDVAGRVQ